MNPPPDGQFDPVFNDVEAETALPVGDGEFMRVGPLSEQGTTAPAGGEAYSSGGVLRQMAVSYTHLR